MTNFTPVCARVPTKTGLRKGKLRKKRAPYTAASAVARHERNIKTLLAPPLAVLSTVLVLQPHDRAMRARGHILAIHKLTGETPVEIMLRLELTNEEIMRIRPFNRTVTETWS